MAATNTKNKLTCDLESREAAVKRYLFIFSDGSFHKIGLGKSLKDAIWEMSVHVGTANELLRLSMAGFGNNDRRLVDLYNHLMSYRPRVGVFRVTGVYTINDEVYSEDMSTSTRLDRLSSAVDANSYEALNGQV